MAAFTCVGSTTRRVLLFVQLQRGDDDEKNRVPGTQRGKERTEEREQQTPNSVFWYNQCDACCGVDL